MNRFFTAETAGERIDKYLSRKLPEFSRSYIQKLLKNGCIFVGEKPVKASFRLSPYDSIECTFPKAKEPEIKAENIPLDILYEDRDILIVNKPKRMVVHPAPGHFSGTLVNALMYRCGEDLSGINGVIRPGIVHRIDRDTTGALLICKNDTAHRQAAAQLKEHSIKRVYEAVVCGNIAKDYGTINAPIGRSTKDRKKMSIHSPSGRPAVTHYKTLRRFDGYTYIECCLETGRTHQIRVHMASIGHPLLGDGVYGGARRSYHFLEGQTLHAKILGLISPLTGEYLEVEAPLPLYFQKLLNMLDLSLEKKEKGEKNFQILS